MPRLEEHPVRAHVHSFERYKIQGNPPEMHWRCADPHCLYVAPQSLVRGKASLCPNCFSNEVILNKEALRRKRPLCLNCQNTKEGKAHRAAQAILDEILAKTEVVEQPKTEEEENII